MFDISSVDVHEDEKAILFNRTGAPIAHADGFAQLAIGYPMSKIYLYSVVGVGENGKEIRKTDLVLSVPTVGLLQFGDLVKRAFSEIGPQLLNLMKVEQPADLEKALMSFCQLPQENNTES